MGELIIAAPENQEVLSQKKEAWGNLGMSIYKLDFKLQAMAQQSLSKLITPTKIEEAAEAERILTLVKSEANAVQEERKRITRPVSERMAELMFPEKSFEEPIDRVSKAIVALKKADEQKREAEKKKLDAITKCKADLLTLNNNSDASFKTKVIDKVFKVYEYALGEGGVTTETLEPYLLIAKSKLSRAHFKIEYPLNSYAPAISNEEFLAFCKEILFVDSQSYVTMYENALKVKFSDYEIALNNKEIAVSKSNEEAKQLTIETVQKNTNANVAVLLESTALTPQIDTGLKALKKSYAVEVEDNIENMVKILGAFVANIHLCRNELTVKIWMKCTPAQMANALAKVKTKNNDFAPAGIEFKQIEKL